MRNLLLDLRITETLIQINNLVQMFLQTIAKKVFEQILSLIFCFIHKCNNSLQSCRKTKNQCFSNKRKLLKVTIY